MKLLSYIVAMLVFTITHLAGCDNSDREEPHKVAVDIRQAIEKKAIVCLGEKEEKPQEFWSVIYDDEKQMFTGASERVCITHYGNIIHGTCENSFPMPGERQRFADDNSEKTITIEYNIERMNIELNTDEYRRKNNRIFIESTVVPYDKLRGPERHRMNRVASCLNSANISLKNMMGD
jgi:hypothetical protein